MKTAYMIKVKIKKQVMNIKKGQEGWLGLGGFYPEEYKQNAYHCNTQAQAEYIANQTRIYSKDEFEVLGVIPVAM